MDGLRGRAVGNSCCSGEVATVGTSFPDEDRVEFERLECAGGSDDDEPDEEGTPASPIDCPMGSSTGKI